jgi:uncharacterized membrane protein
VAALQRPDALIRAICKNYAPAEQRFAVILVFLYVSGFVAHVVPDLRHLTAFTADVFLLGINSVMLLFIFNSNRDWRLWIWGGATYIFTFFVEAMGVATGAVFGEYTYGSGLKWQWLGVPFVIALNWTLLILAVNDFAQRWLRSPVAVALAVGVIIAVYDWFIEPVAIALNYWTWASGAEVPFQNYVAWAVVAVIATIPLLAFKIRYRHPLLPLYLWVQWAYFVAMQWFLK